MFLSSYENKMTRKAGFRATNFRYYLNSMGYNGL